MVMYPTRYHRPADLDAAIGLFTAGEDATYLAGGHTLLPTMKQRLAHPSDLIDLCVLPELRGIDLKDGIISIGATTLHAEVASSPVVRQWIPALPGLPDRLAIATCATAAPSADRSPTTIRLPTIPRPFSAWVRPW